MEETDAPSAATAVAGELDHNHPHQSATNGPLFSQTGLLNSLQPPVRSSAPPSREHSDWLFLCLCRFLPNVNRCATIILG